MITVSVAEQMHKKLTETYGMAIGDADQLMDQLANIAIEGVVKLWRDGQGTLMREYPDVPQSKQEWEAHCAFYRLTVDQRDRAWEEIRRLKDSVKAVGEDLMELVE